MSVASALIQELTPADLRDLADALRPYLPQGQTMPSGDAAGWLTTARAAEYVGMTYDGFKKHADAREMRFEQRKPGGKRWFRHEWLDDWREGVDDCQ